MEQRLAKPPLAAVVYVALLLLIAVLAGIASTLKIRALGKGTLLQILVFASCFYSIAVAGYRIALRLCPFKEEVVLDKSTAFAYCTYTLLNIFVFAPFLTGVFLPFVFRRSIYLLLGTRVGKNTHFSGVVLDPPLVEFGDNVAIGYECVFSAHAFEGGRLTLARIRVGRGATIGARAIILPGVTIGDGAIVAAGAVVTKGTQIGAMEVWAGVPARRLKTLS